MNKGRCLGLLGGLGVGATIHYYQNLVRGHDERGRTLDIVITHSETSRVFEYVQAGDRNGLAEYLLDFIRRLKAAGAEFAAIPAITPHYCVRELITASPLPLFNIFDPLVEELAARGVRRVAVFGTRYVMESSLYGFAGDVEITRPRPDEIDCIHNTYLELLQKGVGTEEQHKKFDGDRSYGAAARWSRGDRSGGNRPFAALQRNEYGVSPCGLRGVASSEDSEGVAG